MNMRRVALPILLGTLAALVVLAGMFWADLVYVRAAPGGTWFLSVWGSARSFVTGAGNPYGDLAAQPAQLAAYGRPAAEGEYAFRLTQPFHLMLAVLPLGWLEDPDLARALWILLTQVAGLALAALSVRMAGWAPTRAWLAACLLGGSLWLPAVAAFDGGPGIWQALWLVAGLLALDRRRDELAGALFAISALRWAAGGLVLLAVLWWCLYRRRNRVLAGFLMLQTLLGAISLIILPGWPLEYARAIYAGLRAGGIGLSLRGGLLALWPGGGDWVATILAMFLLAAVITEWRRVRNEPFRHMVWVFALTGSAAPLIAGRILPADLAGLLTGLIVILTVAAERWPVAGRWFGGALLALLVLGPWLWPATQPDLPGAWLFLLPAVVVLGLYWLRWWALRPPRTWFDQVSAGRA